MASSKLMASSSSTSRDSDLKRKISACSSTSAAEFLRIDSNAAMVVNGFSDPGQGHPPVVGITLLDASGAVTPISEAELDDDSPRAVRKTVDDVWKEIIAGKKKKNRQNPKEEMMTLEDFLVKAGAVEVEEEEAAASASAATGGIVEVKDEGSSGGGIYSYESNSGVSLDIGGLGRVRGKRSLSLLEPMDKAAQQRQRRMIKNRESAARSRERKQAYQVELESMSLRLEEENEQLLKEKAMRTKKRLEQLMENVIPVVERRRPPPCLRKIRSMQW
ncbi:hypothetical protein ABFS82_03G085700 [Erythranthe guttata]|uniref:BZIP domain-containing protein n=1 Tax=Erythranthe guttata TaxID=4155 RepID=A0A022PP62_ERYGU|nr:PREDICTED: G-box-binding factor 4-like [Erythranthe guttata]EYU17461.1 hypothetical protein MIMGU_mgv1a011201mg [Erythranthe guttata]|eukprot:XP_012829604.1 PREDICTED: G-box-binding factor 4-like [Erythranthe guttata]